MIALQPSPHFIKAQAHLNLQCWISHHAKRLYVIFSPLAFPCTTYVTYLIKYHSSCVSSVLAWSLAEQAAAFCCTYPPCPLTCCSATCTCIHISTIRPSDHVFFTQASISLMAYHCRITLCFSLYYTLSILETSAALFILHSSRVAQLNSCNRINMQNLQQKWALAYMYEGDNHVVELFTYPGPTAPSLWFTDIE